MSAPRSRRSGIIVGTVIVGVLINVAIHTIGAAAGATYEFTAAGRPAKVDALTVAGFTALPLLAGLAVATAGLLAIGRLGRPGLSPGGSSGA